MPTYKTFNCLGCDKLCEHIPNTLGLYCSNKCQQTYQRNIRILNWKLGKTKSLPRHIVRRFLVETQGDKCNKCGLVDWQGKPITLWVDHIDGNALNNRPENFQLICPNCDSQQPTFGGKNYGKGRKSRGLPQYG